METKPAGVDVSDENASTILSTNKVEDTNLKSILTQQNLSIIIFRFFMFL